MTEPEAQGAVATLLAQVDRLTPVRGHERLREREGRSVVLALSRSGVSLPATIPGRASGLPRSVVPAAPAPSAARPDRIDVSTPGDDTAHQVLRLVEAVRKAPRHVVIIPDVIVPDKPFGDAEEVRVLGRPVRVGKGAATLAHRTGAAVFGARSRWTGQAFERDVYDFCRAHLEDVLLGPPEDMAPNGGVFRAFARGVPA